MPKTQPVRITLHCDCVQCHFCGLPIGVGEIAHVNHDGDAYCSVECVAKHEDMLIVARELSLEEAELLA